MINIGSLRLIGNAFSLFLWDFLYKSTYIAVWLWGKEEERKGLLFASICQKGVNKTYHRTGWARLLKPVMKPLSPSSPLPCSESLPVPLPCDLEILFQIALKSGSFFFSKVIIHLSFQTLSTSFCHQVLSSVQFKGNCQNQSLQCGFLESLTIIIAGNCLSLFSPLEAGSYLKMIPLMLKFSHDFSHILWPFNYICVIYIHTHIH